MTIEVIKVRERLYRAYGEGLTANGKTREEATDRLEAEYNELQSLYNAHGLELHSTWYKPDIDNTDHNQNELCLL